MMVYVVAVLMTAPLLAGQMGWFSGEPPSDIGVNNERLKPPSKTPNSVSSQAYLYPDHPQLQYASIEPLPLKAGNAATSMQKLMATLKNMPNVTIIDAKPDYIYAQSTTPILKFVHDVEFWVNPAKGVIDVRSASRMGRSDFEVNRKRIETIRAAYLAE